MSTRTNEAREAMLAAFDDIVGLRAGRTLRELMPRVRWRDVGPPGIWESPAVTASIDDEALEHLRERLAAAIGEEHARTAMEYLPPVPFRLLPYGTQGALTA